MSPEHESPYWDEIVQDNWPEVPPGDWSALETTSRDGAAALDTLGAEQARNEFDNRVRASEGLEPIKQNMLKQRGNPQAFADALDAAADIFGHFSDLVYRTRNQILDIVEAATDKIRKAQQAAANDESDDESEREAKAAALRDRVARIIAEARADVEDVVRTAQRSIGPTILPTLERFYRELRQPPPWTSGRPHLPGGPPEHRPAHPHPPGPQQQIGHPGAGPKHQVPIPLGFGPQFDAPVMDPSDTQLPGSGPTELPADSPSHGTPTASPTGPAMPPAVSAPTSTPGVTTGYAPTVQPDSADPSASATGVSSRAPSTATDTGEFRDGTEAGAHHETGGDTAESAQHGETHTATTDSGHRTDSAETTRETASAGQMSPMLPTILPPAAGSTGISAPPSSAPPVSSAQTSANAPAAQSRPGAMESRAPQVDARGAGSPVPKVTAGPAAPVPNAAVPPAKPNAPQRDPQAAGGRPDTGGSDELIRDVVGGAMVAAAAPTFMLGERVDGDLVLARTILGGVLAVVDSSVIGLEWAVSVMRHSGGINAFVTSNEGRSWLPAGLYLPREISTPWMWEVADAAWEGVSDPARVLAEFGAAWGRRTGAKVTAIVSSQPIDSGMRAQLREVPMEGPVTASSAMDLSVAAAGLSDRLGVVAAPQLLDRIGQVPAQGIGSRCIDLAWDAHRRVGQAGAPDSLGLPRLRQRVLEAIRQRREVPGDWWEELRDADDLLAASMLSRRADVSRVALGELRSDTDGRSASEAMLLRAMVFERRCDELVLMLVDEPNRQRLRDATYAHGQIVDHPLFVDAPRAPAPTTTARRPTISTGPTRQS
ncbi:hypothetical protein [Nocardia anaemiae]|uniref:hypothetical protein n=1 Tax=Nocardia anaemiae TaxID=263910 RepID=UPI0007A4FF38|nr:hypothetical protein [Nocardia anaemiae]